MIGEINPNIKGIIKVSIFFDESVSSVKANIAYTIIVNEGGTKSVEINRVNLCEVEEFN